MENQPKKSVLKSEARRLELHELLCSILGSRNVYFQPPTSVKLKYPAILYDIEDIPRIYANGGVYLTGRKYKLTFITNKPNDPIVDDILKLPTIRFSQRYSSDNLTHVIYTLFY